MSKTLEDLLVKHLDYSYDSVFEDADDAKEKLLIEIGDGEFLEVEDIYLLEHRGGIVFRPKIDGAGKDE